MSQTRQPAIRTFGVTWNVGRYVPPQSKEWAQLLYAADGLMTVETGGMRWVAPGHRALWAPPGVPFALEMEGRVRLRNLYVARRLCRGMPRECRTLNITPLLRELILHTVRLGALHRDTPGERRVLELLLDQLREARMAPLQLPMPKDARARAVAEALWREPGREEALPELARVSAMSARTLERIFRKETGLAFRAWRQRARALQSLRWLAAGRSVNDVALEAGYSTASAFIAMFRTAFGTTPGRYFDQR
jgi:AraC-like DNA-binding protein